MEQMKVSSAMRAYPNSFLLLQSIKRGSCGVVEMANVIKVCETKEEAFFQREVMDLIGVKTFIVPNFEETDGALSIQRGGKSRTVVKAIDHDFSARQVTPFGILDLSKDQQDLLQLLKLTVNRVSSSRLISIRNSLIAALMS